MTRNLDVDYCDEDQIAELEEQVVDCPCCSWPNYPMGTLGKVTHYTCRQCGVWYSFEEQTQAEAQAAVEALDDVRLADLARKMLER